MMRVAVIIPNFNGKQLLSRCLESLSRQTFADFETTLVDNASTDDSVPFVKASYPQTRIIQLPENLGFAAAVNAGIQATESEYVAFLNNDTEVDPLWLNSLVEALDAEPRAGSAASKIMWDNARDTVYAAGDFFCREGFGGNMFSGANDGAAARRRWVFSASACASLIRRSVFDEIGLLEERFFIFYEDIDLGFRAQLAGWPCVVVPEAVVYHTGTATVGMFSQMRRYCLARNELFVLARNLLGPILRRSLRSILRRQLKVSIQALDEGWAATLLRARMAAVAALPWLLRSRRDIMAKRRASTDDIARLIHPYADIYPRASIPDAEKIPRALASPTGARALIIRSAGPLLQKAVDYARSSLNAREIDVLITPGHEDAVPSEDGICAIAYPRRERFCGLTMPARFATRLRARGYDVTMILCGGDAEIGFLNVDLVALRAGAKRIIYFMPDGSTREFDRGLFSRKLARFALNACLSAAAFAASVVFMVAVVTATVFEDKRCRRCGAAIARGS